MVPLGQIAGLVERPIAVMPGTSYRTFGVKWWGEGAYERETIDGAATAARTLFLIREGDLVINKIWVRHGSVAIASKAVDGCAASNEFPTFKLDLTRVEPRWIHWQTKTRQFWEKCAALSFGTSGKNRIKPAQFLTVEVPLPPLDEQRRIVARIEEVAGKVEAARGLRAGSTEKATWLVEATASNLLLGLSESETDLGCWLDMNREGIQTGPFGAQLSAGDFQDSGVPVLTIGNVQYGGLETSDLKYVSEEKAAQLGRYTVHAGDLLFARMGTVGRCCLVPEQANGWLINYHIIRVALDDSRVEPRFVHWTIRAAPYVQSYLEHTIRGATRQGVNSSIVRGLPCRVPALDMQRRMVAYLDGLQAKVDELKQLQAETGAELEALLPSVLERAFSGGF